MADERVIFRAEVEGQASIADLRKNIRAVRDEVLGMTAAQREARGDLTKYVSDAQTFVNKAMVPMHSAQARMKEAYFRTGLEVRQLILSNGILTGTFGALSNSFANSVLNAVQLNRALLPLGLSMGGIGIAVVSVIALLPTLIDLFETSSEKADKLTKSTQGLADTLFKVGDPQLLKDEEMRLRFAARHAESEEERIALLKRANDYELEYNRVREEEQKRSAEEQLKWEEDIAMRRILNARKVREEWEKMPLRQRAGLTAEEGAGLSPFLPRSPMEVNLAGKLQTVEVGKGVSFVTKEMERGARLSEEISLTLKQGARQFGSTLVNSLIQGRDLGRALADTLLSIGLNVATGGLMSVLGFAGGGLITEPVIGRGMRSGSMYTIAEKGPEYVTPTHSYGRSSEPEIIVENRITPDGLATTVRRGNRILAQRAK